MSLPVLSKENKQTLHSYAKEYIEWLKTEKGQSNIRDHREHELFYKNKLSKQNLYEFSENDFRLIYKTLWASNVWSNKDWYLDNKLLSPNGFENIQRNLIELLYGNLPISERYDAFRTQIKGFGPSILTEILHFVFPDQYCLWNNKPKTVLPFLKLKILPEKFIKYNISKGVDYLQCIKALNIVKKELSKYGIVDFIDLDIFFWYIFDTVIPNVPKHEAKEVLEPEPKTEQIDSHEAAEYYIIQIGNMLGFNTYTADKIKKYNGEALGEVALLQEPIEFGNTLTQKTAKLIDVIWFNEDDNPSHCFEVEHTTDIVNGLRRLIELKPYHTKFYTIASEEKRQKFNRVMLGIQFRSIKDRFNFISYEELADFYRTTKTFSETKNKVLRE